MTTMTPTPRTDELTEDLTDEKHSDLDAYMSMTKHARELERELADLQARYEAICKQCQEQDDAKEYNARLCEEIKRELAVAHELCNDLASDLDDKITECSYAIQDYQCLAELLDGHDATECRSNLVKLKRQLATERELADKLADNLQIIERMADDENLGSADFRKSCRYCTPKMLTAWKEARNG